MNVASLTALVRITGVARSTAQLRRINGELERTAGQAERATRAAEQAAGGTGRLAQAFNKLRGNMKAVGWGALAAGAGPLVQLFASLAGGAAAVGAALAPLAGLGAAGASGMLAFRQATGLVTLTFGQLTKALAGDKKALAALNPTMRTLAGSILALRANMLSAARGGTDAFAAGLTRAIQTVQAAPGVFRAVGQVAAGTGRQLGVLAQQAARMVTAGAFSADLQAVGNTNVVVIGRMGGAALAVADALRQVLVSAQPLVLWLSNLAAGWAQMIQRQAAAARQSGQLAAFFEQTRQVLGRVISIGSSVAATFWNIGRAAQPLGNAILAALDQAAKGMARWTGSATGRNALAEFFTRAQPAIFETGRLIAAFARSLATIGSGNQVALLLAQIRTGLLPAVTRLTGALGPTFVNALTAVLSLFGSLTGPLTVIIGLVGVAAGAVTGLVNTVPGVRQLASAFLWVLAASKALGPVLAMVAKVQTAGSIMALVKASRLWAAGQLVVAGATRAWAAAQTVLNVVMAANPFVLAAVAVAALVAALVVAYKQSQTFRQAVQAVWAWLQAATAATFTAVAGAVTAAWNAVKNATQPAWSVVAAVLKAYFTVIRTLVTVYFTFVREFITSAWNVLRAVTSAAWGAITAVLGAAWSAIKTAVSTYFAAYRTVITGAWRAVAAATRAVWGAIGPYLTAAWSAIRGAAGAAWTAVRTAIINPIRSAVDWVKAAIGGGGKNASGLVGWLAGAWDAITKGVAAFAGAVKNAAVGAFRGVLGTIIDFAVRILEVVGKIPGVDFSGTIKGLQKAKGAVAPPAGRARGGLVDRPTILVGEQAPAWPEYVIPTNPAYRGRAQGLVARAATAVGMPGYAAGGVVGAGGRSTPVKTSPGQYNFGDLARLWARVNPGLGDAKLMAAIALAESGGRSGVVNSIGAGGLWQIYPPQAGYLDPAANARMAGRKLRSQGLGAWVAYTNGSYRRFLGGGGGLAGRVLGAVGGAVSSIASDIAGLVSQLPGLPDLPGWAAGIPRFMLTQAKDWIAGKVRAAGGLLGGGGGGGLVSQVQQAVAFARRNGWNGQVTSGYRSIAEQRRLWANRGSNPYPVAPPGQSSHGRGQAVDVTDPAGFARAMSRMAAGRLYSRVPTDPIHFSTTGYQRGGVASVPFVGSFRDGGTVGRDGMAMVHAGETVTPAGRSAGPLINIERIEVRDGQDLDRELNRLAWRLEMMA